MYTMKKYASKIAVSTQRIGVMSFTFPVIILPTTHANIPKAIPLVMEPVSPIMKMVMNAMAHVTGSSHSMSLTFSFLESTTGIEAGARTGRMPVIVAMLFAIALFFSGFFGTFTSACTVGALVLVGILMIENVKDIEWTDPVTCAMAFMTIFMMGLTGSITDGIAFGTFAYVVGMAVTGKIKEISPILWLLTIVFNVYFFVTGIVIPNGWL